MKTIEPHPRFAHQLVYDVANDTHYLFGGNPGFGHSKSRLDDLWSLKLAKPTSKDILEECLQSVRRQMISEISLKGSSTAVLDIIRTLVSSGDLLNSKEESMWLTEVILGDQVHTNIPKRRRLLFEHLTQYFAAYVTQPIESLL